MADYAMLLRDHVTLTCRSVDRIFLQAYVPRLQTVGQVCQFLRWQRGYPVPSSAAFGKIGEAFAAGVHKFAKANGIPVRHFAKGEKKEQTARPYIEAAAAAGKSAVALIGIAQEKAVAWRSWPAKGQRGTAHPHMEWGRQMVFVSHFYFYLWDAEWGPAFWKTNAYAPFPVWICLNGHEWAKRQLAEAGTGFTGLDNGFASCQDPGLLQRVCDRLGPGAVTGFFWRWFRRLPSPFTRADLRAGYVYELAFRQFEVSDTRVFGRPAAGRAFFEGLIRDHLGLGRPDRVSLVFGRNIRLAGAHPTPGTFRTTVITRGVDPEITCYYKSSRIRQYFKEHRALRTGLVVCDTRDFGTGRRLTYENWNALRAAGEHASQRLCDAEAASAMPAPDVATLNRVTRPSVAEDGQHAPALRFGDARVMALMAAITGFCHLIAGFDNPALVQRMRVLLDPGYSARQATYDLRRLRRKQVICRIPGSHRYQITGSGRAVAVLFTKTYGRILGPGLAALDPRLPGDLASRSPLAAAWRNLVRELDRYITDGLAPA
ncbi:MAG TPA: hypothetical protein VF070_45760 [Streptosporangiaceae bacterium]